MYNASLVGTRIKNRRTNAGMTQAQLAKLVDTTEDAISDYERGTRRLSLEMAVKIAMVLEVDTDWIAARY